MYPFSDEQFNEEEVIDAIAQSLARQGDVIAPDDLDKAISKKAPGADLEYYRQKVIERIPKFLKHGPISGAA